MPASEREVYQLCSALFTKRELQFFVASLDPTTSERLEHTIAWDAPFSQVCYEVSTALGNRRLINAKFFRELLLARPAASIEIRDAARRLGIETLELAMTTATNAPRAEYRSCSLKQFRHSLYWTLFVSPMGKSSLTKNVVYLPFSLLGLIAVMDPLGLPLLVLMGMGATFIAVYFLYLYRSLMRTAEEQWTRSGVRESDIEILVCAQDGLEIRSPSRASLTPYSLVRLFRGSLGWHIELRAIGIEFFPNTNSLGSPESTQAFWQDLLARSNHSRATRCSP